MYKRVRIEIEVTGCPEFRYSRSGLEVCTIYYYNNHVSEYIRQHSVSFGRTANDISEQVKDGNKLQLTGYFKPFKWRDHLDNPRSRDDFIIQNWKFIT